MAELFMVRQPGGALYPATDEDAEALRKIKPGAAVRVEVRQVRNYKFHRKWFALAKYAFDVWSDTVSPQEYRGQPVKPDFDRFRKDLTILCGLYTPVFNARSELRLEAKSISFSSMSEDEFEVLFSRTIDVVLQKILVGAELTEEQLRQHVDNILAYC
jgi:hypothetical protein